MKDMSVSTMAKRWLNVEEAARYLSVAVYTVRDAAWSGELPFVRAGKRNIFDVHDLDAWAERRKQLEPTFR
jgi:excisionase family DNA binding protein